MRPFTHLIYLVVALALAGCGSASYNIFVAPAKFRFYDCGQLTDQANFYLVRERQLRELMAKAETAPGGFVISTAAYRGEYGEVQGNIKELRNEVREKSCNPPPPGLM